MPGFMLGIICALGFCLVLLGINFIFFPTVFRCDRLRNHCFREQTSIWSREPKRKKLCLLSDVKQAVVEKYPCQNTMMYTVALELKDGQKIRIFNSGSSVRSGYEKEAESINRFLMYGKREMILKDSLSVFFGIVFVLLGVVVMVFGLVLNSTI